MEESHTVIIGTGAEARIAADIFQATGVTVIGFIETEQDGKLQELNDITVFAKLGDKDSVKVLKEPNINYIVAAGEIPSRRKFYEGMSGLTKRPSPNAFHPLSWVSPNAKVGFGNIFNAFAAVNANAQVGDMNHFHSGASVEPDAVVGNYCTLSAGVRIGTRAEVGDEVFIGTGAVIYPGVKVGKGAVVGAGSVVLKEVKKGQTVHGNPAREA